MHNIVCLLFTRASGKIRLTNRYNLSGKNVIYSMGKMSLPENHKKVTTGKKEEGRSVDT